MIKFMGDLYRGFMKDKILVAIKHLRKKLMRNGICLIISSLLIILLAFVTVRIPIIYQVIGFIAIALNVFVALVIRILIRSNSFYYKYEKPDGGEKSWSNLWVS